MVLQGQDTDYIEVQLRSHFNGITTILLLLKKKLNNKKKEVETEPVVKRMSPKTQTKR